MSGKLKVQIEALNKAIEAGVEKIAVLFYSRFPAATFNALTKHPLYQKKDEQTLYFSNGATVTFKGREKGQEYKPTTTYTRVWLGRVTDWDQDTISPEAWEKLRKLMAERMDHIADQQLLYGHYKEDDHG